jgi:hypothetical protein
MARRAARAGFPGGGGHQPSLSRRPGTVAAMDQGEQERALRRIRGLLDKAGSTSFGAEADALYDKAAELMAKHRIDAARLEASRSPAERSPVVERAVDLGSGQYVRARLQLIHHVAQNHGCRVLTHTTRNGRIATVIGIADDCDRVELLYTSLLLQATRLAGTAWAERPHRTGSQVPWKREFMFGFAARVGERLAELSALAAATATAEDASPVGGSVALVLAGRTERVDDWVARAYPRLRSLAPATGFTGHGGLAAGRSSADRADLGSRAVEAGRRALQR